MSSRQPNRNLSPEGRKGAAILAVVALAVAALAYGLFAWQGEESARLAQAQAEYDLVAARAAKALREGAARLSAADNVEQMFLEGATPGIAIASFQKLAGDAAAKSGLSVLRTTPVDAGDAGPDALYRLSIDAEGSLEQLTSFLAEVERGLPVMIVRRLEVQPAAAEGSSDPFPSETLRITVGIDAYGRGEQP